jgi:hypothetical protein
LSLFTKKVKCPAGSTRSKQKKKQVRKEKTQNKARREGGGDREEGRTWEEIEKKPVWETETGGEPWLLGDSHNTELLNKQHKYANKSNIKLCSRSRFRASSFIKSNKNQLDAPLF